MLIAMENKYFSELHLHPSNSFGCQHFRSGRTIGTARTARTTRTDVSASNLVTSSSAAQPPTWPTRATKPTAVCQIERKSLGIQLRWHQSVSLQFEVYRVWQAWGLVQFASVRFGWVWLGLVGGPPQKSWNEKFLVRREVKTKNFYCTQRKELYATSETRDFSVGRYVSTQIYCGT